jgi:serine/threonine protein phosphatase PrpC
LRKYDPNTKI